MVGILSGGASLSGLGWYFWPDSSTPSADASPLPRVTTEDVAAETGDAALAAHPAPPPVEQTVAAPPAEPVPDEILTPTGPSIAHLESLAPASATVPADDGDLGDAPEAEAIASPPAHAEPAQPIAAAQPESGDPLSLRSDLNSRLRGASSPTERAELRRRLAQLAEETVFSPAVQPGDTLFEIVEVRPGDRLIGIGKRYDVPAEAIMLINRIPDATKLRAGQKLKVPRGPFEVRISVGEFRLDLYLQDAYVRSFPVGLGASSSTPQGVWVVKERLENPTYYPPASARDKRIIPPNDPKNPLGEHWIGLSGVEGSAVGQEGFGIHGTIEPESIGKMASMGCVRMHNDDVAWLYRFLAPGKTRVTIGP